MVTGIIILIAAIILVYAIASMMRGKKRGAFDVTSRSPNEFDSHVTPADNTRVNKNEYDLNDKGSSGASQPASPTEFDSPVAPSNDNDLNKNDYTLKDENEVKKTEPVNPAKPTEEPPK